MSGGRLKFAGRYQSTVVVSVECFPFSEFATALVLLDAFLTMLSHNASTFDFVICLFGVVL